MPEEETPDTQKQPMTTAASRARAAAARRAQNQADVAMMRDHLQLDVARALRVPSTAKGRQEEREKLLGYPPMPDHVRLDLEMTIRLYGLPLASLSSDVAAFIIRRANYEFRSYISKQRSAKPPLFTGDELRELLRVLNLEPVDLAEMLSTSKATKHSLHGNIVRWLSGENYPTSGSGLRVNALIERHVRRQIASQNGSRISSTNPDTVRRRAQWNAQKVAKDVPIAPSARASEEEDAEAGDPAAPKRRRRGAIRTIQKGGGLAVVRRGLPQR